MRRARVEAKTTSLPNRPGRFKENDCLIDRFSVSGGLPGRRQKHEARFSGRLGLSVLRFGRKRNGSAAQKSVNPGPSKIASTSTSGIHWLLITRRFPQRSALLLRPANYHPCKTVLLLLEASPIPMFATQFCDPIAHKWPLETFSPSVTTLSRPRMSDPYGIGSSTKPSWAEDGLYLQRTESSQPQQLFPTSQDSSHDRGHTDGVDDIHANPSHLPFSDFQG